MSFIYALPDWPRFTWRADRLADLLASVRHQQGRLLGRMESLGFTIRAEAVLRTLTEDVLKSSEIEGEILDRSQVRSSVARRLGMDIAGLIPADRDVDGVVEMMLDATQNFAEPLTADRLFAWHSALFPAGRSGMQKITVGSWRLDETGPMQVVSGPIGREWVHYEAPAAHLLDNEMSELLSWFARGQETDGVLKAGIAHLWFVTVHPFDDGNGRIARAISDLTLARLEGSPQRFYSMSTQIRAERDDYYSILERTQKGSLDVTAWLEWFLGCLGRAIQGAEITLAEVLKKARFWSDYPESGFNDRQRQMLNRLIDGFHGKLTSSKWAQICKCSSDTALRDIDDLLLRTILTRDAAGGRSTSYSLNKDLLA